MAAPATEHVRNIVLVGQDGAGKTSLAEAMLHVSGRTPRMGTTHDGKSYLDYDEEEIRRKFTIGTSIALSRTTTTKSTCLTPRAIPISSATRLPPCKLPKWRCSWLTPWQVHKS